MNWQAVGWTAALYGCVGEIKRRVEVGGSPRHKCGEITGAEDGVGGLLSNFSRMAIRLMGKKQAIFSFKLRPAEGLVALVFRRNPGAPKHPCPAKLRSHRGRRKLFSFSHLESTLWANPFLSPSEARSLRHAPSIQLSLSMSPAYLPVACATPSSRQVRKPIRLANRDDLG